MKKDAIVIISTRDDAHARAVEQAIAAKRRQSFWLSAEGFSRQRRIAMDLRGGSLTGFLSRGDHDVLPLAAIRTVWCRRLTPPRSRWASLSRRRQLRYRESRAALDVFCTCLSDCFFVNELSSTISVAHEKLRVLRVAEDVGLAVPPSLVTNDPSLSGSFFEECEGAMITKLIGPLGNAYTTPVRAEELRRSSFLSTRPRLFQKLVPKQSDIRVCVIGRKIFATEILSQRDSRSSVDVRAVAAHKLEHRRHDLPADIQQKLHELMRRLGLVFGAVDFALTPDGEYVFLEVNPQGQWLWVEKLTKQPLLENFTEMLIQGTDDYEDRPPSQHVRYR